MAKKKYWSDKQEELFKELAITTDEIKKSKLIQELHPALRLMTMAILHRYFQSNFNTTSERSLIVDAIAKVAEKASNFDVSKGTKGYSFAQTVIKNHFHTYFVLRSNNNKLLDDALRTQITTIPEDQNFQYIDYQPDVEIISPIEIAMNKLRSDHKYWEQQYLKTTGITQYRRRVHTNIPSHPVTIRKNYEFYGVMVEVLDEGFTSFERFILDVYHRSGLNKDRFIATLRRINFNVKGVFGIISSINDDFKGSDELYEPDPDYLFKDYPETAHQRNWQRSYDRRKRKEKRQRDENRQIKQR